MLFVSVNVRAAIARRNALLGSRRINRSDADSFRSEGVTALRLLEDALEVLDRMDSPAEIGAHVDLAIQRLREVLSQAEEGHS